MNDLFSTKIKLATVADQSVQRLWKRKVQALVQAILNKPASWQERNTNQEDGGAAE